MKKPSSSVIALLALALFFSFGACSVVGIRTTPEPSYELLQSEGDIEVRQYGSQLIAETFVKNIQRSTPGDLEKKDFRYSGNQGFRRLAPALQEERSEEIAMTAPVLQEERADGWWMAFVLPDGYTLETAPVPNDSSVSLREVPGERLATLRYSGRNSPQKMAQHEETLRAWLEVEGLEAVGAPRMASYDPPWALPFMRRNEVQVKIK